MMARRIVRDPITELPDAATALPTERDPHAIGPSDSSDSGSDLAGLDTFTDRFGTGERASADPPELDQSDNDILPDRIVDADHAGLGDGLDQAEEAQLGITDEELEQARLRMNPWSTRRRHR
jgi:hypothetical protein